MNVLQDARHRYYTPADLIAQIDHTDSAKLLDEILVGQMPAGELRLQEGLPSGEDHDLRTLTFAKVKNGADGGVLSFRMEEFDLGLLDEDGEALSSCAAAYETAAERPTRAKRTRDLTRAERLVLAAIRHVTDHRQIQRPATLARAVAELDA